ncbi:site-specific integrase [Salicibibacter halophilus]|nr:site-specific integrase [Salicibibacter halophilus]
MDERRMPPFYLLRRNIIVIWHFGLRFSEVLGLQWQNIDFNNNTLHVYEAYHEKEKELGRLKTESSRRDIPISDQQAEYLKQYKENQTPKSDVVVVNLQGGYMMKRNLRRAMQRICERAEVKQITFHELRHTHATLMLEMNEHVKIVQQRLGHVKAETTMDIYSHVRPQVHKDSAERFSNFFNA